MKFFNDSLSLYNPFLICYLQFKIKNDKFYNSEQYQNIILKLSNLTEKQKNHLYASYYHILSEDDYKDIFIKNSKNPKHLLQVLNNRYVSENILKKYLNISSINKNEIKKIVNYIYKHNYSCYPEMNEEDSIYFIDKFIEDKRFESLDNFILKSNSFKYQNIQNKIKNLSINLYKENLINYLFFTRHENYHLIDDIPSFYNNNSLFDFKNSPLNKDNIQFFKKNIFNIIDYSIKSKNRSLTNFMFEQIQSDSFFSLREIKPKFYIQLLEKYKDYIDEKSFINNIISEKLPFYFLKKNILKETKDFLFFIHNKNYDPDFYYSILTNMNTNILFLSKNKNEALEMLFDLFEDSPYYNENINYILNNRLLFDSLPNKYKKNKNNHSFPEDLFVNKDVAKYILDKIYNEKYNFMCRESALYNSFLNRIISRDELSNILDNQFNQYNTNEFYNFVLQDKSFISPFIIQKIQSFEKEKIKQNLDLDKEQDKKLSIKRRI